MLDGKRLPVTVGMVKYYFKYLFTILHYHFHHSNQIFETQFFWSHFFHPTFPSDTKNHTAKQNEL